MMFTDLVTMIERTYRVCRQGESRHGGFIDGRRTDVCDNVDEPGQVRLIGGFSGNCGGFGRGNDAPDMKTTCGGAFADPAAFNAEVKLLFLGIRAAEGRAPRISAGH